MPDEKEYLMEFILPNSAPPRTPSVTRTQQNPAAELQSQLDTAQMKQRLREIANELVARLEEDLSVDPPRAGDNEERAISGWEEKYRGYFVSILAELIAKAAGDATEDLRREQRQQARIVAEMVLPDVIPELRRFALRHTALRWGASRYPNFIDMGQPEFVEAEGYWRVPLEHVRTRRLIGQISLDSEGNVITEKTTTTLEARKALNVAA